MPITLPNRPGPETLEGLNNKIQYLSDRTPNGLDNYVVKRVSGNTSDATELTDPTSLTAFDKTAVLGRGALLIPGTSFSIYAAGDYRMLVAGTSLQINANLDATNNLCTFNTLPTLAVTPGATYRPWTIHIHCIVRTPTSVSAHAVYTVYDESTDSRSFTSINSAVSISTGAINQVRILATFGASNGHKIRLSNLIVEYAEVIGRRF